MMDYQTFATRREARDEARKMRFTGWPRATVDYLPPTVGDPRKVWLVCATHGTSQCQYLRVDGYVR